MLAAISDCSFEEAEQVRHRVRHRVRQRSERGDIRSVEPQGDPVGGKREAGPAAAGAAGVAAGPARLRESKTSRFIVDFWLSYDITELSADAPNYPPQGTRLTLTEQNDSAFAIDLAVGRYVDICQGLGSAAAADAEPDVVFQRVKPRSQLTMVAVGHLCQRRSYNW